MEVYILNKKFMQVLTVNVSSSTMNDIDLTFSWVLLIIKCYYSKSSSKNKSSLRNF